MHQVTNETERVGLHKCIRAFVEHKLLAWMECAAPSSKRGLAKLNQN